MGPIGSSARDSAPHIAEILLCGSDCVRCGACSDDAGSACAFEGSSVPAPHFDSSMEESYALRSDAGVMLDEPGLALEVAAVFERHGFPTYAARFASEVAVEAACEMWSPCRSDGSI